MTVLAWTIDPTLNETTRFVTDDGRYKDNWSGLSVLKDRHAQGTAVVGFRLSNTKQRTTPTKPGTLLQQIHSQRFQSKQLVRRVGKTGAQIIDLDEHVLQDGLTIEEAMAVVLAANKSWSRQPKSLTLPASSS